MVQSGALGGFGAHAPAVRGAYMRLFASHVDRLPAALCQPINRAVPLDVWQLIDGSGAFSWLPLEVNLTCTRAVGENLSPADMQRFFRTLLLDTARSPVLHGLVESVLRIAVADPSLYLVWVAKGYQLLFRNAGTWEVRERAPGFARLVLKDAPPECVRDPLWLQSLRGGLASLFDLKRLTGTVDIIEGAPGAGVMFETHWIDPGR